MFGFKNVMERGIRKILTFVKRSIASKIFGKSFPRMTEHIQILQPPPHPPRMHF